MGLIKTGWNNDPLYLSGWWFEPTHLKNMLVKMGSSSPNRGENKKYLKPPPGYFFEKNIGGNFKSIGLVSKNKRRYFLSFILKINQ